MIGSIEDIAQPTLSNTASIDVGVEAVETAIQQEMHMEEQSANTDFKKGHILQNDFEERKKVHEVCTDCNKINYIII